MFTKRFWKSATERALKTGAQAFIVSGGGVLLTELDIEAIIWAVISGIVLSYATSIASSKIGDKESPEALPVAGMDMLEK